MRHTAGCFIVLVLVANGCGRPDDTDRVIRAVLADQFKVDAGAIPMDQPISDPPLKADELDLVEIVMELEERLDIEIADAALERRGGSFSKGPIRITPSQLISIARESPKARPRNRER
jgi:acyl carrier protein